MKKVLLIKTKGCLGCQVMHDSIDIALRDYKEDITFETVDSSELSKDFIRTHKITDFPTTILFKNDRAVFKAVGSVPSVVVLRWLNVQLK